MMFSLFDWVENTVVKGENDGYQHFLLFLQCFPKPSSLGSLKFGIVWRRMKKSLRIKAFENIVIREEQEDHDGPISLT